MGGGGGAAVKRRLRNDKDVGSNILLPNEKRTLGIPPTEGGPRVWAGSQWKTGDVKRTRPVEKTKKTTLGIGHHLCDTEDTPRSVVTPGFTDRNYPGLNYSV